MFGALEQAFRDEVAGGAGHRRRGPAPGRQAAGRTRPRARGLVGRCRPRPRRGPRCSGGVGGRHHPGASLRRARARPASTTVSVFIESFAPPPQMLVFGAVDFTKALVRAAKVLGYRVTVCDAREVFATRRRFPQADDVVVDWPHRLLERVGDRLGPRDAICVLTHDHKFDVPAIVAALRTDVGYLGAMGSRRTHAERVAAPEREGRHPARARSDHGAHRSRHRLTHARGDRHLDLRRDHRPAHRSPGAQPPRLRRRHPPPPDQGGLRPRWAAGRPR